MRSLLRFFKWRVITPDCPEGKVGKPLMTRWFIFRRESFGVFVHLFHRSDLDEFHDHPWTFITFLVGSGYWEHVPSGSTGKHRVWRPRFSVLYRPAEYQHYVEVVRPTWTIVLRFKQVREWGFIKDGRWTHWRAFEDLKSRSICE